MKEGDYILLKVAALLIADCGFTTETYANHEIKAILPFLEDAPLNLEFYQ